MKSIGQLIDELLTREGGYVNNPADKGGPTNFGITEAVARAHGYHGSMRDLHRGVAAAIYRSDYWVGPRFSDLAKHSAAIAYELFDTGVNMGPRTAVKFLQRALNGLNRNQRDYADIGTDGRLGSETLDAVDAYFKARGHAGEVVLLRAIEALQGERYLALAERRPANEQFLYGWLANRIGNEL